MPSSKPQEAAGRDLSCIADTNYDVTIIGGGISGAWLALHCAQAGHKTLLVEKHDYASQTSSASSKLLHGGIRYLQQLQFFRVRESAMERAHYLYAAPHLSKAVPFALPTYPDLLRSKILLNCGMLVYRALCLGENRIIASADNTLPKPYSLNKAQLNRLVDLGDQAHTGAVVFYERHMHNSERMALSIINTARDLGATAVNYLSAQNLKINDGRITGLELKDELSNNSYSVNSKLVINAAGPWIDDVIHKGVGNREQADSNNNRINGFAVGSHIITRKLSDYAIGLTTKHKSDAKIDRGGRHIFVIPWQEYSLIGTSYDEIDSPSENLQITSDHVDQLLEAVNDAMPSAKLTTNDVISGYSGLYPLRTNNIDSAVYQGSGEYQIVDHANGDNIQGLITALGAKFTTARKLSALTMKIVADKLGGESSVQKTKLHCSNFSNYDAFRSEMLDRYSELLPIETIQHLLNNYGSDFESLILRIKDHPPLLEPISGTNLDIMGQIVWATEREQAQTLDDVLFRRTSIGHMGISSEEIEEVARVLAAQCNWDQTRTEAELESCLQKINNTQNAIGESQSY